MNLVPLILQKYRNARASSAEAVRRREKLTEQIEDLRTQIRRSVETEAAANLEATCSSPG